MSNEGPIVAAFCCDRVARGAGCAVKAEAVFTATAATMTRVAMNLFMVDDKRICKSYYDVVVAIVTIWKSMGMGRFLGKEGAITLLSSLMKLFCGVDFVDSVQRLLHIVWYLLTVCLE